MVSFYSLLVFNFTIGVQGEEWWKNINPIEVCYFLNSMEMPDVRTQISFS
jgi:hypothetical protein